MNTMQRWQDIYTWHSPEDSYRSRRHERFARLLTAYRAHYTLCPSIIKVTGTNGKGSVCAMLEAMLLADGQSVGVFTSPHLIDPTERIRINGVDASDAQLDDTAHELAPLFDRIACEHGEEARPSFFEALLLLGLRLFGRSGARFGILEAAIGGSNDIVSLVPGAISVISSVALDHMEQLGPSVRQIAVDKSGIATHGSVLILGPRVSTAVRHVISRTVRPRDVVLRVASLDTLRSRSSGARGHDVELQLEGGVTQFTLPLPGAFQIENLATVVAVHSYLLEAGLVSEARCLAGVANTRWPGRLEFFAGRPSWLLDGAHNLEAFTALQGFIEGHFVPRGSTLIFGTSHGEKALEALTLFGPRFDDFYLVGGFYKAASPRELVAVAGVSLSGSVEQCASPADAVELVLDRFDGCQRSIVVAGSLYLTGACRALLLKRGYVPREEVAVGRQ